MSDTQSIVQQPTSGKEEAIRVIKSVEGENRDPFWQRKDIVAYLSWAKKAVTDHKECEIYVKLLVDRLNELNDFFEHVEKVVKAEYQRIASDDLEVVQSNIQKITDIVREHETHYDSRSGNYYYTYHVNKMLLQLLTQAESDIIQTEQRKRDAEQKKQYEIVIREGGDPYKIAEIKDPYQRLAAIEKKECELKYEDYYDIYLKLLRKIKHNTYYEIEIPYVRSVIAGYPFNRIDDLSKRLTNIDFFIKQCRKHSVCPPDEYERSLRDVQHDVYRFKVSEQITLYYRHIVEEDLLIQERERVAAKIADGAASSSAPSTLATSPASPTSRFKLK